MPIDLFEQSGINNNTATQSNITGPKDLFAENNVSPGYSEVESSVYSQPSSPFMAAVTGFNRGVERITGGWVQRAAEGLDNDFGTNLAAPIKDYMARKEAELAGVAKINPVAAKVGEVAGVIGLGLTVNTALPAVNVAKGFKVAMKGLAATGAIGGAALSPDDPIKGAAVGAATAAVLGAVGAGVSKGVEALKNVITGGKYVLKSPETMVDDAIQASGVKVNPNVTIGKAEEAFNNYVQGAKAESDKLYAARDLIAKENNVNVKFDNLVNTLKSADEQFIDPKSTAYAVRMAKKLSDAHPDGVPFSIAQKFMSKIGRLENTAYKTGDSSLARDFGIIKNSLLNDIDKSAKGINGLEEAQNIANVFYRDTYRPLKDVAMKNHLKDGFVNESFITSFLRKTATDPSSQAAYSKLPEELKQTVVMSHIKALKASKLDATGEFNPLTFANALNKELSTIPALSKTGVDIENIARAAMAANQLQKASNGQLTRYTLGVGAAAHLVGSGGISAAAAGGLLAAKLPFLYTAGKILNNPTGRELLTAMQKSPNAAQPIKDALASKLASMYAAQAITAPASED